MAADSLQIAAKAAAPAGGPKPRGRPFRKGQSGNPAGRIRGSRNKKTLAAELLLEGEAEALTRKAIEMALEGDPTALKLCFESLHSRRRHRSLRLDLPPLKGPADPGPFMAAIAAAIGEGEITSGEASELAQVVETAIRAIASSDLAVRRAEFEERVKSQPQHPPEPWELVKL
jgi:hypothetical protein